MSSLKMTFSLASLVLILGLARFGNAPPVMAHPTFRRCYHPDTDKMYSSLTITVTSAADWKLVRMILRCTFTQVISAPCEKQIGVKWWPVQPCY